jgi:hypothetical protein
MKDDGMSGQEKELRNKLFKIRQDPGLYLLSEDDVEKVISVIKSMRLLSHHPDFSLNENEIKQLKGEWEVKPMASFQSVAETIAKYLQERFEKTVIDDGK